MKGKNRTKRIGSDEKKLGLQKRCVTAVVVSRGAKIMLIVPVIGRLARLSHGALAQSAAVIVHVQ